MKKLIINIVICLLAIYYSGIGISTRFVVGQSVQPTCENVEVFITMNNYYTYVCNDYNKSWKNYLLNGTFSYSSTKKVLIYKGLVGSKINYRFSTCTSSTSTPNYSILLNDRSVMKYPHLNPSTYCNAKDACNLGVSKASGSDISGLSYIYLKDYSNKMTFKRLSTEELLIQSMYLYLCSVSSTTNVVDLGIVSPPSHMVILSNQDFRNASNVVTIANTGVDPVVNLYLNIKFDSGLDINQLTLSISKAVRVNLQTNAQTLITGSGSLSVSSGTNSATWSFTSLSLNASQSLQLTVLYKWKTNSTISSSKLSTITYTTSTNGLYYDPMVSYKVQSSSISLVYLGSGSSTNTSSNNNTFNSTVGSNPSKNITTSTNTTNSPISNSTVYVDPNSSNTYYSDYGRAIPFQVNNTKRVIISYHFPLATSCFVQTYFKFNTTFSGSILVTSSTTSQTLTFTQSSVSGTSFIIPPKLLNCNTNMQTTLTFKVTNGITSNTSGTLIMIKKSKFSVIYKFSNFTDIKSMAIDQTFLIPKQTISGEVNALLISSFSSRDTTPQDITLSTSALSTQPYTVIVLPSSEIPSILDYSNSLQFSSNTPSYSFSLKSKQVNVGSVMLVVGNYCETCSASMSFTVPNMYSNPSTLGADISVSQTLTQSSTGSYPYFINYAPTDSKSYLLALVTVQSLISVPPTLKLTATQGTLQRDSSEFLKTVTVNCQNENTKIVQISTWLQANSGVWKFKLQLDPAATNSNTLINYAIQSISSAQQGFATTVSSTTIKLPYFAPPTENVLQRFIVNTGSNNFQLGMVFDSQNLNLDIRKYEIFLSVGYTPTTSKYDIMMDFSSSTNFKVNIISTQSGMLLERGTYRKFKSTSFSLLDDKGVYLLIVPNESVSQQSCSALTNIDQAKFTYTMITNPNAETISSSSYQTKFTVKPGTIVDLDFRNVNFDSPGNFLIEIFSQQYTSLPTPALYGVVGSEVKLIQVNRKDFVTKQYQTTMKAVKFVAELSLSGLKQYSKVMFVFPSDPTFPEAYFRGTAEKYDSLETLYIENYFFESYIAAGCLVGVVLLYSVCFSCIFCGQTVRKKKINIDNEKEWESFIPAMCVTLPMFLSMRLCSSCVKMKDQRENRYRSVLIVGVTLLVMAVAWLGAFGSIVGIVIYETVGLMQNDSDMVLSNSAYACCAIQSGMYSDMVYNDLEISTLANTYKCVNVPSDANLFTDFYVNSVTPSAPISNVEGGLTAVAWANLQCKGSKLIYVPEKFELAKYLCIVWTFGIFILGCSLWFFIFLIIACVQAPKRKRYAIKAPSSSSNSVTMKSPGQPKKQNQGISGIPYEHKVSMPSVHRSPNTPTSPTRHVHTHADYDVFFPIKESNSPLNKRRQDYEMFDIPILSSPPPIYTPHPQSPTNIYPQQPQSPRSPSAYYTYEPPSYDRFGTNNGPVQNGMLPPPPPYSTIVLPPVQSSEVYHDDNMDALTIPTPEAVKMTSQ